MCSLNILVQTVVAGSKVFIFLNSKQKKKYEVFLLLSFIFLVNF